MAKSRGRSEIYRNSAVDRKPNAPSARYQYQFFEIPVKTEQLSRIPDNRMDERTHYQIVELQVELINHMLEVALTQLTPHQQKVLQLTMEGKTQNEIAAELNATQTAVHKCLMGNLDYKHRNAEGKATRYGGVIHKMQKLLMKKPEVLAILKKIQALKNTEE